MGDLFLFNCNYFAKYFIEKRGYDPQEKLPYLFFDGEGAEKIRHDYWKTVAQRFEESYMKQVYQLQHLSCNIQQAYKKYIVNIQQICLYNTNTIITSMTIKNVIKLVIKLVMKLKVRRGYEFEVKQKVQGYIVQEGFQ